VWIGTNGGLNRLDPATGTVKSWRNDAADPASLSDNRVRAVFQDSDGALWVGTNKGGLDRLRADGTGFDRFRQDPEDPQSLIDDHVRTIFEDVDRRLWIGTDAGLDLLDRSTGAFTHYTHDTSDPNSLADTHVISLYQDRGGVLWVGTRSAGLSKWNPRAWSLGHHRPDVKKDGQEAANITSFAEDTNGRLWVGSFGAGLLSIDRTSGLEQRYRHDATRADTLSDDRVMALLSHRSRLWRARWAAASIASTGRARAEGLSIQRRRSDQPQRRRRDGAARGCRSDVWVGTFGGGVASTSRHTTASCAILRSARMPRRSRAGERLSCLPRMPPVRCGSAPTAAA
jgi:ligand-binding sensor domain-containing protein